jgi:hypothetical protein
MPYKNPEDKQRWEREHREQRNTRRKAQRITPKPAPDPILTQEPTDTWKTAAGIGAFALAVGISLFAGWVGLSTLGRSLGGECAELNRTKCTR